MPVTRVFSSPILALGAHVRELAVATQAGVELLSTTLEPLGHIAGTAPAADTLVRLTDGRWIAFKEQGFTTVHAGRDGGALAAVWPNEGFADAPIPTPRGFVANYDGRLYVDEAGEGRWIHHGVRGKVVHVVRQPAEPFGASADDRLILTGETGLGVIDREGMRTASSPTRSFAKVLGVWGGVVAVQEWDTIALLDLRTLETVATLATGKVAQALTLDGDLVVAGGGRLSRWDPIARQRRWERPVEGRLVAVEGGRLFVATRDPERALVFDRDGERLDEVPLDASVWRTAPLGEGCVLVTGGARVVWWRTVEDARDLPHDLGAERVVSFAGGLLTTEGRALHVWRPDADGAAASVPITTAMPMDAHVVTGGLLVKTVRLGHFRVIVQRHGHQFAVDADAPSRTPIDPAEASSIVTKLVERRDLGPLPTLAPDETEDQLAQRPLAETAPLHARALFDPSTLADPARLRAEQVRSRFFTELGHALGVSPRTLLAGVRAGRVPLTPPRDLMAPYEYVGSFDTGGKLWAADPGAFAERGEASGPTTTKLGALAGTFHVFLRSDASTFGTRTSELVAVHDTGFDAVASTSAGTVMVDSGLAGVFDDACPPIDLARPVDEGTAHGRGALSQSGAGDGGYPIYVARTGGKVVKVRLAFLDDAKKDRATPAPPRGGRKYAASERFAVGESIEHNKFGAGVVESLTQDGKIVVRFGSGPRTLLHGR